ncbi:MAG: hypothetical protein ACH350_10115 [Parachlamydiaceae bacterium]
MIKLNKYNLNFEITSQYIKNSLDEANILSTEILRTLNFNDGFFFTLLPENISFEQIHHFSSGGILSQNREQEYIIDGVKSIYSLIPSIDDELAALIFQEIKSNNKLSCIFDDVNCCAADSKGYFLFDKYGLSYENESYYLLRKKNINIDLVKECLKISNSFWHSLCLFTKADLDENIEVLIPDVINKICTKTELVVVSAYDREGYIFWERNNANSGQGFFAFLKQVGIIRSCRNSG